MSVSPYAYVGNNPINYIDPFGLWAVSIDEDGGNMGGGGGDGVTPGLIGEVGVITSTNYNIIYPYGTSFGQFDNGGGDFSTGGDPSIRMTGNGRSNGQGSGHPLNIILLLGNFTNEEIRNTKESAAGLENWDVIFAYDMTEAANLLSEYTEGEAELDNLVVSLHGSTEGGTISLKGGFLHDYDITNFMLIKDKMQLTENPPPAGVRAPWSLEKLMNTASLASLSNNVKDGGTIVYTSCNADKQGTLGEKLVKLHGNRVNVLLNTGTSEQKKLKRGTKNKKTGVITIIPGSTYINLMGKVSQHYSTWNQFSKAGKVNKGVLYLTDDKNNLLDFK